MPLNHLATWDCTNTNANANAEQCNERQREMDGSAAITMDGGDKIVIVNKDKGPPLPLSLQPMATSKLLMNNGGGGISALMPPAPAIAADSLHCGLANLQGRGKNKEITNLLCLPPPPLAREATTAATMTLV